MALIGNVLLWLLWIVLGLIGLVLALLIVALLIPVQVWLRYDTAGFAVQLKILFFKMQLLPAEEKQSAAQRPAAAQKTTHTDKTTPSADKKMPPADKTVPSADKTVPPADKAKPYADKTAKTQPVQKTQPKPAKQPDPLVRRILENLPAVLHMAGRFVGAVLRSLRFNHLEVVVPVSGGAPDEIARRVGKVNAWFYAIVSPLENGLHLRWKQVRVFPDYKEEYKEQLLLAGCVRGQLLPVAIAALHLLGSLKKENIL